MADQTLIEEVSRRLAAAAAPGTRVILFGSHARGDAGRQSNLDFLIVEPKVEHPGEESVRLRRALRGLGVAADVIVVSAQDAAEWQDVQGSLVHAALSEGRELVS
jgi:predicted nucleotidyltransferase